MHCYRLLDKNGVIFFNQLRENSRYAIHFLLLLVTGSFSNDDGNGSEIVTQQDATECTLRRRGCGTD